MMLLTKKKQVHFHSAGSVFLEGYLILLAGRGNVLHDIYAKYLDTKTQCLSANLQRRYNQVISSIAGYTGSLFQ